MVKSSACLCWWTVLFFGVHSLWRLDNMFPRAVAWFIPTQSFVPATCSSLKTAASDTSGSIYHLPNGKSKGELFGAAAAGRETFVPVGNESRSLRDLCALKNWAVSLGVVFAPGVQLVEREGGDWGVSVEASVEEGAVILCIPPELEMTSSPPCLDLEDVEHAISSLHETGMGKYVPEFFLMMRLLDEVQMGSASLWYEWIRSLPIEFDTGLYMDTVERAFLGVVASEFLEHQDLQWDSFSSVGASLLRRRYSRREDAEDLVPLLQWAFSVVFTRSWRTQDGNKATIVPLGDMFNHRGHSTNVMVTRDGQSGGIIVLTTQKILSGEELYLSYGMSHYPGRFLVIFGFCDPSATAVFANITFDHEIVHNHIDVSFNNPAKLVFRSSDGDVCDAVWDAVLYKILSARDPERARDFCVAHKGGDWKSMLALHSQWELEVTTWLQRHVGTMLSQLYSSESMNGFTSEQLTKHPRLQSIVGYKDFVRGVLERAQKQIGLAVDVAKCRKSNLDVE